MLKKLGLLMVLFGMTTLSNAQQSLGEVVSGAGFSWLMGDWQATSENGDTIQIGFKPDLDNHIAIVSHKDSRAETKGIVILDPSSPQPKYYSGDNLGGAGSGVWSADGAKAVLKYKHTSSEGRTTKMGITFAKLDADSMEVKIYPMNDQDELGNEERVTLKFKRKK